MTEWEAAGPAAVVTAYALLTGDDAGAVVADPEAVWKERLGVADDVVAQG